MPQFILLFSTGDAGHYDDHIEVECSGRKLTTEEALALRLVTRGQLSRHRLAISYDLAWYEVKPGDEIIFDVDQWVWENEEENRGYLLHQRLTFVVPPNGLLNPPVDLDEFFRQPGELHEYYGEHATQKH